MNDFRKDLYVRFTIKLTLADGTVRSRSSKKIRAIHHFISRYADFKSAYLKAAYDPDDKWLVNQYDCDNAEELKAALLACAEPELLDYIAQGRWRKAEDGQKLTTELA